MPSKSPAEGLRLPSALLTLTTLSFLLILFPTGSYDIHPGQKQMTCD